MSPRALALCLGSGAVVVAATFAPHPGLVALALVSVGLVVGLGAAIRRVRR
jgi:hypothetical protein